MTPDDLQYMADRLNGFNCPGLDNAVRLLDRAQANYQILDRSSIAEHSLCNAIWSCITSALDQHKFAPAILAKLNALEAELAGRTLSIRLAQGWLERTATGPTDFPAFETFIN